MKMMKHSTIILLILIAFGFVGTPIFAQTQTITLEFNSASSSDTEVNGIGNILLVTTSDGLVTEANVTVSVSVTGGTANAADYSLTGTITIPAGTSHNSSVSIDSGITIVNDINAEISQTVDLSLSSPVGASLGAQTSHTFTITDDERVVLYFSQGTIFVNENSGSTTSLSLRLIVVDTAYAIISGAVTEMPVSFEYYIDIVTSGFVLGSDIVDFYPVSFTIAAGATSGQTVSPQPTTWFTVINDSVDEANEAFDVEMRNLTNAIEYDTLYRDRQTVIIRDDDTAGVTVTQTGGTTVITEGGATDSFTIRLNSEPSAGTVTIQTAPDSQCDLGAGAGVPISLNFDSSNWSTTQTVNVTAVDDTVVEGSHSCVITNTLASSGASEYTTALSVTDITATVTDNESTTLTIDSQSLLEDPTTMTFTVTLPLTTSSAFTVNYTIANGSAVNGIDFSGSSGTLSFAGTAGETQTISVTITEDAIVESNESFTVTLSSSSHPGVSAAASGTGTIQNDDSAAVTIADVSVSEGNTGTTAFTFTASLDNAVAGGFTVNYASANGSATLADADYSNATGTLSFTGNAGETQTFTVNVTGDYFVESDENFNVSLNSVSNASVGISDTATGTIQNDDTAGIGVSESAGSTAIAEGGANDSYGIALNSVPRGIVTITLSPDSQCTLSPTSLIFAADASALTAQNVTVTGVDDLVVEGNHSCAISQSISTSDTDYAAMSLANIVATVTDNDSASIILDTSGLAVLEEESSAVSTSVTIAASTPPTSSVDILISPDAQCDLGAGAGVAVTVTLPANLTSAQMITIFPANDTLAEAASHTCAITTGDPGSSDGFYDSLSAADIPDFPVDILDNDVAFTITNSGGVPEGTGTNTIVNYTISPSAAIANVSASLDYSVSDTTATTSLADFTAALPSGTLNFAQNSGAQVLNIEIIGDLIAEPNFILELSSSSGTSGTRGTVSILGVPSTLNMSDDDTPGLSILQSGGSSDIAEAGLTDDIRIFLNTQPSAGADVSITVTPDAQCEIDGNGAGTAVPITIANASWNTGLSFTITAIDDTAAEGNHSCMLSFSNPSSAATEYNGAGVTVNLDGAAFDPSTDTLAVNVTDNDSPGISFSPQTIDEGGLSRSYTLVLNTMPSADVSVDIINPNPDCRILTATPLIFTSLNWNVPQTIDVVAVDDNEIEGNHRCVIVHTLNSPDTNYSGVYNHSVEVRDNDSAVEVEESPDIDVYDPAISKVGILLPGQLGLLGEVLEWTVTISNNGNATGQNVVFTDTLRPELQIDGVRASKGSATTSAQTVTVNIGNLAPNEVITIVITTTVLQSNVSIDNTACSTSSNAAMVCVTSNNLQGVRIASLPQTGETPFWAYSIMFALLTGIPLLIVFGCRMLLRR